LNYLVTNYIKRTKFMNLGFISKNVSISR